MRDELPGVLELAWWMFMKPVRLHRRLTRLGIALDAPGWRLWRAGGRSRQYLLRMSALLILGCLLAFPLNYLASLLGFPVDWARVARDVAFGVAFGVGCGVVARVALGVVLGVPFGVVLGVPRGVARGVAVGMVLGVVGMPFGVAFGVAEGVAVGVALGVAEGVARGVAVGVAVGVASILSILQAPFLPMELPVQLLAYAVARTGRQTLHWAPVLHRDLSYVPHPFLADHIVLGADAQPDIAREILDACAIAPGQRRAGRRALVRLQARDLERLVQAGDWSAIADLQSAWLPGVEAASPLLLAFREVARHVLSAQADASPRAQLQQIERACKQLTSVENALQAASSDESRALRAVLPTWRTILDQRAQALAAAAAAVLPNPFRAGRPLSPDKGAETFRGREALSHRIGQILADPTQHNGLVLLGPWRSGKTSLLKMLPVLLPDALVVSVDLQDNPTDSPRAFFEAIAKQAREAARHDRRFAVPPLPDGPPFEAASAWLDALETSAKGYRVLLCVDEFERLEALFPGDRAELLRLMGLLRGNAQHRRAVHLLVSGVAPFDELDLMWSDHFIGAHELRVEHLDEPTTVGLLTRPSDDFPPGTIPTDVAEEVFRRTDGQPYLVQLYGQLLVLHLDATKRRAATLADVDAIQDEVYSTGATWFRFTFSDCTPERQALLRRLADGEPAPLAIADQRWLQRRGVVTPDGRVRVPVFATWIRDIAE